jgi:hypothetical protein
MQEHPMPRFLPGGSKDSFQIEFRNFLTDRLAAPAYLPRA